MNNALKALVAVACIAVIVVAALWWSDRSVAPTRLEAAAKSIDAATKDMEFQVECYRMVQDWDGGRQKEITKRYGDGAEQAVDNCREVWKINNP